MLEIDLNEENVLSISSGRDSIGVTNNCSDRFGALSSINGLCPFHDAGVR
jgi:hypothetical protein